MENSGKVGAQEGRVPTDAVLVNTLLVATREYHGRTKRERADASGASVAMSRQAERCGRRRMVVPVCLLANLDENADILHQPLPFHPKSFGQSVRGISKTTENRKMQTPPSQFRENNNSPPSFSGIGRIASEKGCNLCSACLGLELVTFTYEVTPIPENLVAPASRQKLLVLSNRQSLGFIPF